MPPSPANQWTTGRGFLESIRDEANEVTEMLTIAVAIADQGSKFDIDFGCTFVMLDSGEWHDTGTKSPDLALMDESAQRRFGNQLARAVRYLDLRGQLVRHTSYPHLIRFVTEESLH